MAHIHFGCNNLIFPAQILGMRKERGSRFKIILHKREKIILSIRTTK